ncbi:MAG: COX15/CtaA family protein [Propionivibrio sp.]|uniref:COX15/CtaA family protein n=1 Tax=Propionivibrio sp. TaxID=2212460 RepID=UPI001A474FC6|nr:COX15/CtaA family protein [Propionivibrio sp.]MBL8414655.1 COX15/CtaA family protein [Propionivibrio sp.]
MVHRYFAGVLGLLIVCIAMLAWRHRRSLLQSPWLPTVLVGVVGVQAFLRMWTDTLCYSSRLSSAPTCSAERLRWPCSSGFCCASGNTIHSRQQAEFDCPLRSRSSRKSSRLRSAAG